MGGRPITADTKAEIIRLLGDPMLSYRVIGERTGASASAVGRLAAESGQRSSSDSPKLTAVVAATEVTRTRAAATRAAESERIIGLVRGLNDLIEMQLGVPELVNARDAADLTRALANLTRAHGDLEATERAAKAADDGGQTAGQSMVERLVAGFAAFAEDPPVSEPGPA